MKHWAQFYDLKDDRYVEGVGDRQLILLDGRLSRINMERVAAEECRKRGYAGWRLVRGERFTQPFYLTAAVRSVLERDS